MVLALHWWWRCLSSGPQLLGMWTWLVVVARVWRWRPTSGPSMGTLPLACIGGPSVWTRGATYMSPGTARFLDDLRRERGERRGRRAVIEDEEDMRNWWAQSWSGGWRQRISVVVARNVAQMLLMRARVDYCEQRGAAAMAP